MYIQHTYGKRKTLIYFFLSLKNIHELREILHSLIGEFNIVKMSNFPDLMFRKLCIKHNPNENPTELFFRY